MNRPSVDEYFLRLAYVIAQRSTCDRKHVGALIVDDNKRIVSTGYNGSPAGSPHCSEVGHQLVDMGGRQSCIRTLHAESNALDYAGREARGCTIYITVTPCLDCSKRIVNAGIKRAVWHEYYGSRYEASAKVRDFLIESGVSTHIPADEVGGKPYPYSASIDAWRDLMTADPVLLVKLAPALRRAINEVRGWIISESNSDASTDAFVVEIETLLESFNVSGT